MHFLMQMGSIYNIFCFLKKVHILPLNNQTARNKDGWSWVLVLSAARIWVLVFTTIKKEIIECRPLMDIEMVVWSCRWKYAGRGSKCRLQTLTGGVYALLPECCRLHWKRWGEGREHKHNHRISRDLTPKLNLKVQRIILSEVTVCSSHHTGVHKVTDGDQRGWMFQQVTFKWSCNSFVTQEQNTGKRTLFEIIIHYCDILLLRLQCITWISNESWQDRLSIHTCVFLQVWSCCIGSKSKSQKANLWN